MSDLVASALVGPHGEVTPVGGLTKREWYAGMALNGLLSHPDGWSSADEASHDAVAFADALIAALKKDPPP